VVIARGALLTCLVAWLVACGEPAAHVQLAPVNLCPNVTGTSGLRVIAFTPGGDVRRPVPPTEIDAFPGDTEQLGVEVLGSAGEVVRTGKTGPLDFASLGEGTQIPVVMAPPGDFCATVAPPLETRTAPAVALAGDGVLIVGGVGTAGTPLATAEYYDAKTATFQPVSVPGAYDDPVNGFAGVALAEMPDGRVAITGTAKTTLAYFDPATLAITAPLPFDVRAFHAALAIDNDHLMVMGGCAEVAAGACSGPLRHESYSYDLRDLTMRTRLPTLPPTETREGGALVDLGVQADGVQRFALVGADGSAADRFALADDSTEAVTGLRAQTTAIDGDALLSADGSGAVEVAPGGTPVAITPPPAIAGVQLVTLEDGSVLAIGDQAARYVPSTNSWMTTATPPDSLANATVTRLPDGSVLALVPGKAYIYRPSLVGPQTGQVVAAPDGSQSGVLTAPDVAATTRTPGHLVLNGDGARVLVGGTRMATGVVSTNVKVTAGGVELIAQQTAPGRAIYGRLVPGEHAQILRADGSACTGAAVTADDLTLSLSLAITGHSATLSVADVAKATCDLPDAGVRGAWGLAAAGDGAQIDVGPVTVTRTR
jgi:hypothetical protein